ncbi:MAG: chemotaxis protein CheW [Deltaproteobacteria bacterium RBG_13_60_28]|jgi:purine-binding chemotaxis protein CheW|nr:MAG: chemotaxis protein CheW [Deltaproteobacteria bacterium RBG_13_60_28]
MSAKKYSDSQKNQGLESHAGKYLTFELAQEEYGIGILKIKEIIGMMPITPVPHTPPHVKGIINLRGMIIPVTDLRLKFGLEVRDYTDRTCIIVVEVNNHSGKVTMGLVVDGVSEVSNIKGEDIADTPDFGARVNSDYIQAMAKMEGRVKLLLDIDRVLHEEELACLNEPQARRRGLRTANFPLEEDASELGANTL